MILRLVLVIFLISEIIAPPFPSRQPTWFDANRTRADTGDSFGSERNPFKRPVSVDLVNTTIVAFCAGEYLDSTLYETQHTKEKYQLMHMKSKNYNTAESNFTSIAVMVINRSSQFSTGDPILIEAPVSC